MGPQGHGVFSGELRRDFMGLGPTFRVSRPLVQETDPLKGTLQGILNESDETS